MNRPGGFMGFQNGLPPPGVGMPPVGLPWAPRNPVTPPPQSNPGISPTQQANLAASNATGQNWANGGQAQFAQQYGLGTPAYNAAVNAASPGGQNYLPPGVFDRHPDLAGKTFNSAGLTAEQRAAKRAGKFGY